MNFLISVIFSEQVSFPIEGVGDFPRNTHFFPQTHAVQAPMDEIQVKQNTKIIIQMNIDGNNIQMWSIEMKSKLLFWNSQFQWSEMDNRKCRRRKKNRHLRWKRKCIPPKYPILCHLIEYYWICLMQRRVENHVTPYEAIHFT